MYWEAIPLTADALVWPAIVASALFVIGRAFVQGWREARRQRRHII